MIDILRKIEQRRREWEEKTMKPALKRFGLTRPTCAFYTPLDTKDFDFLEKVGFPGEYPFTSGTYPIQPFMVGQKGSGSYAQAPGMARSGDYSGYGTAEDMKDHYLKMQALGQKGGPNLAFDLPTQCGYDSDSLEARGEVGKVGVAVSTLRDFEVIFEAFTGERDIDKIASNFTINAPSNVIMAMYIALAQKRGIPIDKLTATPQNEILKEFAARSTFIFPPRPSMRMFRDSAAFFVKQMPNVNIVSIGGYHIREAGATREQVLAFSMSIAMAYAKCCTDAGLDIDDVAPKFTFTPFGGSMEFFQEIALCRAARRVWAKIVKERFGAKKPRSMLLRSAMGAGIGYFNATRQRPLNNLTRSVVGGIAGALSGSAPSVRPPYDEPLGLGWSLEAQQLREDAGRILQLEARLNDVMDPLAGSYYVENLTDGIENGAWQEIEKIDKMGGAVAAIEAGYIQREIARSAYEYQRQVESGERVIVGVNCYTGENELEVLTTRVVPHPYDLAKKEQAEAIQVPRLKELKRSRDNKQVARLLTELKTAARKEDANLMPNFIDCVKAYVSLQEICDVLRGEWGEYKAATM